MENPNLEYYEELIHAEDAIQFDGLNYAIVGTSHQILSTKETQRGRNYTKQEGSYDTNT